MVRMMQIMTISVCTARSSGDVQYGVMAPDSQSRMGLHSHIQITVRALRPSLVFDAGSAQGFQRLANFLGTDVIHAMHLQQVREDSQDLPARPAFARKFCGAR